MVAPSKANIHFRKLLTTPKIVRDAGSPAGIRNFSLDTEYGSLTVYSLGQGPAVLFVHGWSGGGKQFFQLMKAVERSGFQAISFDHFAHGKSDHHESNLPLQVIATEVVGNYVTKNHKLAAVVSHSLGCVASLNAFGESLLPQVLVSPLLNFIEALYTQVYRSGLPAAVLDELLLDIEKEHNLELTSLDIIDRITEYRGAIQLIHDYGDKYADHQLSRNLVQENSDIKLHSTNGLGHTSILFNKETQDTVTGFLNTACRHHAFPDE